MKEWKIIAFRQPHTEINQIKYGNITIELSDVFFSYEKRVGKIDLELYLKGYFNSNEWMNATFLLLDNVIGEYNTEVLLNRISKNPLVDAKDHQLLPIAELPKIIKDYKYELSN